MKVFKYMGLSLVIGISLVFSACSSESGSSDDTLSSAATTTVTAVDGYIKNATLTDNGGKVGTYSSNGQYNFSGSIAYPLTLTGGELEDTNASFDINMTAQEGALVISPITTFLENNSTLLGLVAGLNLSGNPAALSSFAVNYVDSNNSDMAKLSQLLYLVLKDSNLTREFKLSLSTNPSSLTQVYTLLEADVNTSIDAGSRASYRIFITAVKNLSGDVSGYESTLDSNKTATNVSLTPTHNGVSYGTITSLITGKVWLDRNLGSSQVCMDVNDTNCHGDYYQWGRNTDGHEKATSNTVMNAYATNVTNVGHSDFILDCANGFCNWTTNEWASVDQDGQIRKANWSKVDGSSVCPIGYRVPSVAELTVEFKDQNISKVMNNFKLAYNGRRSSLDGQVYSYSTQGSLWSSSIEPDLTSANGPDKKGIKGLSYDSNNGDGKVSPGGVGVAVRCVKD